MKISLTISVFLLLTFTYSFAQIPGVYSHYIPHSGSKSLTTRLYKEGVIPKEAYPNKIMEFKGQKYFIYQKTRKSDIRAFKILKEADMFYLLCNDDNDVCQCKAGTFFYFKTDLKLQRIEKPFSFSLKKNLISRLKKYKIPLPNDSENMTFCELLQRL
ncbi:hypothetical protein CMT34_17445 [Elizabethkingia anophelis]|jgi:hypothetical protein|nr:hypothetical protein [Elizabethkingia anophelis]MDV4069977.1 hypothetical protein [Elizabethkingia anophelis]